MKITKYKNVQHMYKGVNFLLYTKLALSKIPPPPTFYSQNFAPNMPSGKWCTEGLNNTYVYCSHILARNDLVTTSCVNDDKNIKYENL